MSLGAVARARLGVLPVVALALPWRCDLVPGRDRAPLAKREAAPARVPATAPSAAPAARAITLPDAVVVKALDRGQPAFLRCWARAQRLEGLAGAKVKLHVDLDPTGKIVGVSIDSDSPTLSSCVAVVARSLAFPAPGQPAVVDAPLIF